MTAEDDVRFLVAYSGVTSKEDILGYWGSLLSPSETTTSGDEAMVSGTDQEGETQVLLLQWNGTEWVLQG